MDKPACIEGPRCFDFLFCYELLLFGLFLDELVGLEPNCKQILVSNESLALNEFGKLRRIVVEVN